MASILKRLMSQIRRRVYPKVANKRKFPRRPISVKVTNQTSGFFGYFNSTNISVGGMFLKSEEPMATGTLLNLEFNLPTSQKPVKVEATVTRVMRMDNSGDFDPGMGIKFQNLAPEAEKAIEAFVNMVV